MDKDSPIKFFSLLYMGCRGFIELRPFTHQYQPYFRGRRWIPAGCPKALVKEAWKLRDHHLFFGVATRTRESKKKRKGSKKYLLELPALYSDIDFCDYQNKDEVREIVGDFPFPPSCIIHSGNGLHLYWFLDSPYHLVDKDIRKVERVLRVLQGKLLHADHTPDVSRVLRVPGSRNLKDPKEPKPVRIQKLTDRRFSFRDFIDQLHPWLKEDKSVSSGLKAERDLSPHIRRKEGRIELESLKIPRRIKRLIKNGKSSQDRYQSRSEADQAVITCLMANRYPEELILEIFRQYPKGIGEKFSEKGPFGERYLKHSIRSAKEYLAKSKNED